MNTGSSASVGLTSKSLRDDALGQGLYAPPAGTSVDDRPEPDLARMRRELRRPGVTLELLHVEYLSAYPTGNR